MVQAVYICYVEPKLPLQPALTKEGFNYSVAPRLQLTAHFDEQRYEYIYYGEKSTRWLR
jgi:hypothetical protein